MSKKHMNSPKRNHGDGPLSFYEQMMLANRFLQHHDNNDNNDYEYDYEYNYVYDYKYKYDFKYNDRNESYNAYETWQNIHETVIQQEVDIPKKMIIVSERDISTLDDLLNIIEQNDYDPQHNYNIDLKLLHLIKNEIKQLISFIGLYSLKTNIFRQILYFIQGFANDLKDSDYKHTILIGPPGTGKTEMAKLLGTMYSKMGILKNNVFKKVTRADLVAGYLGQTAIKTRKVIDDCSGGVLFIDEAYSLQYEDAFAKECVDTLCEAMSDRKNNLMVIIAGYQEELDEHLFRINRGLRSRFIWCFKIDPYESKELFKIFQHLAITRGWKVDRGVELKIIETNMEYFKENGRSMEQLFSYSKIAHSSRVYGKEHSTVIRKTLTSCDIENGILAYKENVSDANNRNNKYLSLYI